MLFISVMAKLYFQQPLLLHDPSEISLICWFGAQVKKIIIINV